MAGCTRQQDGAIRRQRSQRRVLQPGQHLQPHRYAIGQAHHGLVAGLQPTRAESRQQVVERQLRLEPGGHRFALGQGVAAPTRTGPAHQDGAASARQALCLGAALA